MRNVLFNLAILLALISALSVQSSYASYKDNSSSILGSDNQNSIAMEDSSIEEGAYQSIAIGKSFIKNKSWNSFAAGFSKGKCRDCQCCGNDQYSFQQYESL
ncbi:hypothetical protein [Xenorhabdus entomophaga]|uniref:hypothetical protein n=1 Tax=Xenorhabdus entomophaga TaxID=3136257 RepID=UPI0030F414C4